MNIRYQIFSRGIRYGKVAKRLPFMLTCLLILVLPQLLVSCSGGDIPASTLTSGGSVGSTGSGGSGGTGGDTGGTIGSSGPPNAIALTLPYHSVTNLSGGVYQQAGTLKVTDKFGNAVADGTEVELGIIDSVIVEGNTGEFTDGSYQFSDALPMLSDGTLTGFNQAAINRNNVMRFVQTGDWLLVTGVLSYAEDKVRNVGSSINSTLLPVETPFLGTNSGQTYVIGASMNGISIEGMIADAATPTWTANRATTKDGETQVRVRYPANPDTIHLGCTDGGWDDPRFPPAYSGRVFTIATAGGGNATLIKEGGTTPNAFCYWSIAGWTLTTLSGNYDISGSSSIGLILRDGGDQIPLPYEPVYTDITTVSDTNNDLVINASATTTDINGYTLATITVVSGADSGDQAQIKLMSGDALATINLNFP